MLRIVRFATLALCALLASCSPSDAANPLPSTSTSRSPGAASTTSSPVQVRATAAERLAIRFEAQTLVDGLTLAITSAGDHDGRTTFANPACCGIEGAQRFVRDVRVQAGGRALRVAHDVTGWSVEHSPGEILTIRYRLPPSGATTIDGGIEAQMRPLVHDGLFHLIGSTALLLPVGRDDSERLALDVDATAIVAADRFVSSFGPGNDLRGRTATRAQVRKALYLGGPISLSLHDTPSGRVGVVTSALDPTLRADDLRQDALAILAAERAFFDDSQPWYLVSVHGGRRKDPGVILGGGMGLTNAFVMYVTSGLDFADAEHREQFRWVLAHEYFHQWNGLTLRVASLPGTDDDDASVYWFSEGVTEFYTMRLLTRAGLQTSARSRDVLADKLRRYAANTHLGASAMAAGKLFWTDADGEQIPYLRGYLAAWAADLAMRRNRGAMRDLDATLLALVRRAKAEPGFRVDNAFLVATLGEGLSSRDAARLRRFIIDGGDVPLDEDSFGPCLVGTREAIDERSVWQFDFADAAATGCFRH